jgi:hypothetical protein
MAGVRGDALQPGTFHTYQNWMAVRPCGRDLRSATSASDAPASSVQRALAVSAPTARTAIDTLERAGIVREITGRRWGKAYQSDRILDLLRAEEQAPKLSDCRPGGNRRQTLRVSCEFRKS